ncbi:hypothetical protein IEO21_02740 [Rhodonia placenta]|uniref:UBC core domain-containing protein n=1 Tax=Rhodonia placenta TaxID=104341 RepID=A0A8H7P7K1_9APHY|nr:hypothetical protein IEO21_02740 [Postia placenta]
MSVSTRRLQKELTDIQKQGTPVGIKLLNADDFQTWHLSLEVLGDTVYEGEVFALKFRFDSSYPISSPAVQFVVDDTWKAPVHPHVYSNGHICASILGNEWSPVLSVISVCVTLQSMLASCKFRNRPPGNDRYVKNAPENPKKTRFEYHGTCTMWLDVVFLTHRFPCADDKYERPCSALLMGD